MESPPVLILTSSRTPSVVNGALMGELHHPPLGPGLLCGKWFCDFDGLLI